MGICDGANSKPDDHADIEIVDAQKRQLFERYTGFYNIPFDPEGRLTNIRIEFLESAKSIVKCLSDTTSDGFARVVLVVGTAGIGKSTAIEELNNRVNQKQKEFRRVRGISFGGKLRSLREIENYEQFLSKVVTSSLEPALENMDILAEFKKRYDQQLRRFKDEYAPEIYASLTTLKSMGFQLIHFYVDELDLIESAEPSVRTNFIHFFRDLGESMVNEAVPVAITLYAVKEAAAMIEEIFAESHMPANMSIEHVRLFATKEELKSIYTQRTHLKEWKSSDGAVVPLRAPSRDSLERKYSPYHPFTESSIETIYDLVIRDLQETPDELSTLRPIFRIFHRGFWFEVDKETAEPIGVDVAKQEYAKRWFYDIVEPIITRSRAPFTRLSPEEKDSLSKKLGDLRQPAQWSLSDIFSTYALGLEKCVKALDRERFLEDVKISYKEDQTVGKSLAYGSTFLPLQSRSLRFNILLFREKFDLNSLISARQALMEVKPYAQLSVWIVCLMDPSTQYAKLATEELRSTLERQLFFFQNQEQAIRVLSQSVVDETSATRIQKEGDLAEIGQIVASITNWIKMPKEIISPADRQTVKNLIMTCLVQLGREKSPHLRKHDVDKLEGSCLRRYDAYAELAANGFVEETDYIFGRFDMKIPPSLKKAAELILQGGLSSDRDGKRFFDIRWPDIKSYLQFFQVLSPLDEFSVQDMQNLDSITRQKREQVMSLIRRLSDEGVPETAGDDLNRAEACLKLGDESQHFKLGDLLQVGPEFERYIVRSIGLFFANEAQQLADVVREAVESEVPRIEVHPEIISERGEQYTPLDKAIFIKNSGRKDLLIRKIANPGKQVLVQTQTPITIRPGEMHELMLRLLFASSEQTMIILDTNDPNSPKKQIKISAVIEPAKGKVKAKSRDLGETKDMLIPAAAILRLVKKKYPPDKLAVALKQADLSDSDIGQGLVSLLEKKKIRIASV